MKRLQPLAIPIVLFGIQAFLALPYVSNQLASDAERTGLWAYLPDGPLLEGQIWLWLAITVLFAINQWFFVDRPYTRSQRFESLRLNLIQQRVAPLVERIRRETGVTVRVNVMMSRRRLVSRSEPGPNGRRPPAWALWRLTWLRQHLSPMWRTKGMQHHRDHSVTFSVAQGACGKAYRTKEVVVADLTVDDPASFGLNAEQIERTQDLRFVISFPIRILDLDTLQTTDRVAGVVNIDSRDPESERLVQDDTEWRRLVAHAQDISELCSHFL